MAHTICGIDVGAYSVKFAFFEVGFRTKTLRGSGDGRTVRRSAAAAAPDGRRPRGPRAGLRRGDAVLRAAGGSALGARAGAAVLGLAQDRSGRRLRAGGRDRSRDRGRRLRSPRRRPAARRFDRDGGGGQARRSGHVHGRRGGRGIHPRALYAAPLIYRTLLPFPADVEAGSRPVAVPGGPRLRAPPHQHLLRSRRRSMSRARSGAAAST